MIRNRLNILLAERNLTIKDVNENTGLSRTTISNMINGISDGLQMKTLDILCNYLEVTPSDFFDYAPFIYKFYSKQNEDYEVVIEIKSGDSLLTYWYSTSYDSKEAYLENESRIEKYDLYITIYSDYTKDPFLDNIYNKLSVTLKNDFKTDFCEFITKEMSKKISTNVPENLIDLIDTKKKLKTIFRTPFTTFIKTYDSDTGIFL